MNGASGLLGAELRRFFMRRVTRGAFAFGLALSTLVLVIITVRSDIRTVSRSSISQVCSAPTGVPGPTTPGVFPNDCTTRVTVEKTHEDHRLKIGSTYSGTIKGTGVAMVFLAFIIGSSFIGAEFAVGSLGSQLVFEPRRARVIAAKAVAVAIGLALLAIALLLYIGILQLAGSSLRGVVHGLDASWFVGRVGDIGRVAAAVALAGTVAFAITVVARRTVAAVAGLIVVAWVSAIVGQLDNWRWVAKYNPTSALISMAVNLQPTSNDRSGLTVRAATLSSCLWAVGLTIVAATIFARREVR